jgi:hypothetical protein
LGCTEKVATTKRFTNEEAGLSVTQLMGSAVCEMVLDTLDSTDTAYTTASWSDKYTHSNTHTHTVLQATGQLVSTYAYKGCWTRLVESIRRDREHKSETQRETDCIGERVRASRGLRKECMCACHRPDSNGANTSETIVSSHTQPYSARAQLLSRLDQTASHPHPHRSHQPTPLSRDNDNL